MQIEKFENCGYFTFAFEPDDWKTAKIQDMLEEIKAGIPSAFREYNPESFKWTVEWRFFPVFWEIRSRYFENENQLNLI